MSVVWLILGVVLVTVVLSLCIVYFVVRPRLVKRVEAGALRLGQELHGREPVRSGPASCEGVGDPDKSRILGIGALGVTDQAVVFAQGETGDSIIIMLSAISSVQVMNSIEILAKTIRRANPMLVLDWQNPGAAAPNVIAFTLDDAQSWKQQIDLLRGASTQ